jgi:hypothetical protein
VFNVPQHDVLGSSKVFKHVVGPLNSLGEVAGVRQMKKEKGKTRTYPMSQEDNHRKDLHCIGQVEGGVAPQRCLAERV